MPLEEPSWWYGDGASEADLRVRLLAPIARVYGWAAERRFRTAAGYPCRLPVICVGNFTAGGTGKTPLSLLIATYLKSQGAQPVFLTRGYGGRRKGPYWVNPTVDLAAEVGDEPLLLAKTARTLVARDRAAGARAVEAAGDATHIVMDDGLQNPSLRKSLSIAVVDGQRGLGNGEVIPAGPLRAPLGFQFALADAVVVNGGTDAPALPALKSAFPGPVLEARVEPEATSVEELAGTKTVAFSGIGNPQRFFDLLHEVGAETVALHAFKDHHTFSEAEASDLMAEATGHGARLVTTEKDLARLKGGHGAVGRLWRAATPLRIRLALDDRDMGRLTALLDNARAVDQ